MTDDAGQIIKFGAPPSRVVSLLPSATEVICAINAHAALAGVTYQDTDFEKTAGIPMVGGTSTPQFGIINGLSPDLLIVGAGYLERAEIGRGEASYQIMAFDDGVSLERARERVMQIGGIFGLSGEAARVLSDDARFTETIRLKTSGIPPERRKRVLLVSFGEDGPETPGDGSFQTDIIKAAGGVTGGFGEGKSVPLTPDLWRGFAPDFVFTTEANRGKLRSLLEGEEWRDIPGARDLRIYAFPEALVDRAAAHVGYFTAWLSSSIYATEFSLEENLVYPMEVLSERAISIDIPYVSRARIVESRILDFTHRTLLIDFKRPQSIASTVTGERSGIETVGNSYSPTSVWPVYHALGFGRSQDDLFKVLGLDPERVDIMLTGADMNNISIQSASYRDMTVTAIVTAGVEGNAIRTSRDTGAWYEPGTINILLMTNHNLSKYAATRAIVTVTEAKTAALWDMDIRSVQTPLLNPATGTGTDTVIIVAGEGAALSASGGHSKMGELIAEAVYRGVQDAILKQNGKAARRGIFERLAERGLYTGDLFKGTGADEGFQLRVEEIMLDPKYTAFIEASLSLSDARATGQVSGLGAFDAWALAVASEIAGRRTEEFTYSVPGDDIPGALKTALGALATGVKLRDEGKK
jgi:adenosylcobinamide amidohydrolase/ABC-type Fe3+-hydroxamate transport system substrate-binding protein